MSSATLATVGSFKNFRGWRVLGVFGAALAVAFLFSGCDEYVHITRDPDAHILKGSTWAWRPAPHGGREVISRDVIGRREAVVRDPQANNAVVQEKIRNAISQDLTAKGLHETPDAQSADYLVDFSFAVEHLNERVGTVYPGGYPGLVCGPFRCWESWGWGPPEYGYQNIHFREGTFLFNFTKHVNNQLVYRAVGEKPVHHGQFTLSQDQVNDMIHRLLKDLKVRR